MIVVVGLTLSMAAAPAAADVGKRDFSYGSGVTAPTGQKPQSKLWWTSGGQWWGVLWSTGSNAWTIHKYDKVSRTWSNTGVVIDNRRHAGPDAMWDGSKLYVVMALKEGTSSTDARILVYRFSLSGSTWSSLGAPTKVKDGKPETLVIDKDSTGKLWITYAEANGNGTKSVYVVHTTTNETTWGAPYVLPVTGTTNVKADDISSVVAYGNSTTGRYVGVLYSNQTEGHLSFARHRDGAGDAAADWQRIVLASGSRIADGHLNIKGLVDDPTGRVFAVVKTSLNDGSAIASDPLIVLHTINGTTSTAATVWRVSDNVTRAVLMLDSENKNTHVFAAGPCCSGGTIYTKSAKYDSPSFSNGLGTPFIQLSTDTTINNPTSSKQTVNSTSGLLVEAGNDATRMYVHNFLPLSPAADTTPPDTTITSGPAGTVASGSASFTFSSTEAGSTFECRLDSGPYGVCGSPKDYSLLAQGAHTFDVRAKDAAGNVDATPASRTWTIDTTPPETTLTSGPSGAVTTGSASFAFTSEAGASFECRLDAGAFAPCTSPANYSLLADGSHTFEVRAKDGPGNVDLTPASRTWTVDTAAPDTTITTGPSGTVASGSASFAFTSSDAGASFECRLDDGAFAACTSPKAYSALGDGAHSFEVRAKDGAGNVDATPASRTWTIDTTAPQTSIDSGPSGNVATSSASFAFSASEGGSSFECRLDDAAFASCTSPKDYSALSDGEHTFQVRAKDGPGNVDLTPASRTWTIDTTPPRDTAAPDTTIDSGPTGTVATDLASFTFSSSESGSSFECSLDGGAYAACTSPKDYTALSDGTHTFDVRATDAALNTDPSPASRTWTINTTPPPDTSPPETTIDSGPTGTVTNASASFTFSSSESGSSFECSLDGDAYAACTSPKDYTALSDGTHTFDVRATDAALNTDPSPASRTWTIDATPPDTTITSGPTGTVATSSASFALSTPDNGSSFECRLDDAAYAPCTSPKDYGLLADGTHTFDVRAKDDAGNVDPTPASRTWTIDTTPPDTTITTGPSGTVASGSASFTFSSSEAGSSFECSLDGGTYAPCTSPKDYSLLADGTHTFDVRAKDAAGNVDAAPASRTWTIASTTTVFSDDFESGTLANWQVVTGGDGTAAVQTATVKTGTYAARFSETSTSGSLGHARRAFATALTDFTVTADFNVLQEGASGGNVPLLRLLDSSGARIVVAYRQNATGGQLWVTQNGTRVNTTGILPLGAWRNVELRVKIAGAASIVQVKVDGRQVYTTSTAGLGTNGIKTLQLGNETAAQQGTIAVDNLSVRTGP
ncbi:MAG TPA: hypothetical protein VNA28_06480 [Solirubrobacteraceae bacterium]|nr:hypothetical protein [Solirubrobacteraceae bacterium]